MLISIIIAVLLLYVAFNTKLNGDKLPEWIFFIIVFTTLVSWESALVALGTCTYFLYKGVKSGEISTVKWIEDLIK